MTDDHILPTSKLDHISVCICTFKRPEMLAHALEGVTSQITNSAFSFEVVIVDNDHKRSAEDIVRSFQKNKALPIIYDCEPEQNISLARNRATRNARGNLIAFMDDDEFPGESWLINLLTAIKTYKADGVLGPVKPFYKVETPLWLKKSGLCERPTHKTGTVLNYSQTRTGNVLFNRSILEGVKAPFPPEMGREGGEDIAFFKRMISNGYRFVWCDEAVVYENIPPERYERMYYINKSLRVGGLTGETLKNSGVKKWKLNVWSGFAAILYILGAGFGLMIEQHVFMRYSTKLMYHLGRIAGCFGFVPIRERRDQ